MSLDFYSQEDTFCELENYMVYCETEPSSFQLLDSFGLREYDKLTPWIALCASQGIKVGSFFDDTVLRHHQLPQALANLYQCCAHLSQSGRQVLQQDATSRMVVVIRTAFEQQRGLIAFCD